LDEQVVTVPLEGNVWDISGLGDQVGWLTTTGRMPGDDLAMVFVSHVTLSALRNGPFARLWTLEPGSTVVYSSDGADYVYAVSETVVVSPQEIERLYVPDGRTLLLVTCSIWSWDGDGFAQRVITRAQLATEESPIEF